jgi:hypothetical protein
MTHTGCEVSLLSATLSKESSGGDAESVVLSDSASLGNDLHLSTNAYFLSWLLQSLPVTSSAATVVKNVVASSRQFPFNASRSQELKSQIGGTPVKSTITARQAKPHLLKLATECGRRTSILASMKKALAS